MDRIPAEWLPKVRMDRIICHWTAGGYAATDFDRGHYHILIDGDGDVVRGHYSISANSRRVSGNNYAMHTGLANSFSIGVSCCCMAGARERPFDQGSHPMKKLQWDRMTEVVAQLCDAYSIPVTKTTVLGHGEVEANLGRRQRGKWDPMKLPWNPELTIPEVGELLREQVSKRLAKAGAEPEDEPTFELKAVIIRGKEFTDAVIEDGDAFVNVTPVAKAFDITIESKDDLTLKVRGPSGRKYTVPYTTLGRKTLASCLTLSRIFELTISWNPRTKIVTLD